jgi:hypothetical protein
MDDEKININNSEMEEIPGREIPESSFPENSMSTCNSFLARIKENKRLFMILSASLWCIASIAFVFFVFVFILYLVPRFQEAAQGHKTKLVSEQEFKTDKNYTKQLSLLTKDVQRLSKKYSSYTSGQSYIVINTTYNRFYLYNNKKLIREGTCSTGSYKRLQTAEGRSWTFKTPRGKFSIQGKRTNPSWHKPDWAFIEEGLPVPPRDSPLRWEPYVLGDYALDLGDSYMIHGTIYKRQLGMPVTHGCVRMNDEDLEVVFRTLNLGSKVYIY